MKAWLPQVIVAVAFLALLAWRVYLVFRVGSDEAKLCEGEQFGPERDHFRREGTREITDKQIAALLKSYENAAWAMAGPGLEERLDYWLNATTTTTPAAELLCIGEALAVFASQASNLAERVRVIRLAIRAAAIAGVRIGWENPLPKSEEQRR